MITADAAHGSVQSLSRFVERLGFTIDRCTRKSDRISNSDDGGVPFDESESQNCQQIDESRSTQRKPKLKSEHIFGFECSMLSIIFSEFRNPTYDGVRDL